MAEKEDVVTVKMMMRELVVVVVVGGVVVVVVVVVCVWWSTGRSRPGVHCVELIMTWTHKLIKNAAAKADLQRRLHDGRPYTHGICVFARYR
jgi:hypothetical protein